MVRMLLCLSSHCRLSKAFHAWHRASESLYLFPSLISALDCLLACQHDRSRVRDAYDAVCDRLIDHKLRMAEEAWESELARKGVSKVARLRRVCV